MAQFPGNDIMSLVTTQVRHDLAESVGPDLALGDLLAPSDLADLKLAYGTAAGDPRLRAIIAATHGVDADDVILTVGGMHALFLLAFILCDRGDEAVITAPLFPLARTALEAVGAQLRVLRLSFAQGYQPDLAAFRATLSPRTKLVSLASPQNPSGVALAQDTIAAMLAAMRAVCPRAYLLLDETYREAAYGDAAIAPSAVGLGTNVVSIASLSKCHGAPGLRLGWAITRDAALRAQVLRGKFNTVISCSAIDEALGIAVLQQHDRIIDARRAHLAAGLAMTGRWVRDNADLVEWVHPDAGALCCVRLRPAAFDDAAVARAYEALPSAGVRVAHGAWFDDEPRVFRLGFGLMDIPALQAALAALAAALRQVAGNA